MKTKFLYASLLIYAVGVYAGDAESKSGEAKVQQEELILRAAALQDTTDKGCQYCFIATPHSMREAYPAVIDGRVIFRSGNVGYCHYTINILGKISHATTFGKNKKPTDELRQLFDQAKDSFGKNGGVSINESHDKPYFIFHAILGKFLDDKADDVIMQDDLLYVRNLFLSKQCP